MYSRTTIMICSSLKDACLLNLFMQFIYSYIDKWINARIILWQVEWFFHRFDSSLSSLQVWLQPNHVLHCRNIYILAKHSSWTHVLAWTASREFLHFTANVTTRVAAGNIRMHFEQLKQIDNVTDRLSIGMNFTYNSCFFHYIRTCRK